MKHIKNISLIIAFGFAWNAGHYIFQSPMVPPLGGILSALIAVLWSGEAWPHIWSSVSVVTAGLLIAFFVFFPVGSIAHLIPFVKKPVLVLADFLRPVAALTLFPLLILALGISFLSKTFVIFWTAWPPILINTVVALGNVEKDVLEAALIDGASKKNQFFLVSLPLAHSGIMTGVRVSVSAGWISLIAAEMLGANSGLGYSVLVYSQTFRFNLMYAYIVLIAICGYAMNTVALKAQMMIKEMIE